MRMAISPLLAAMSFFIWRRGANANVRRAVAARRRSKVERIIFACYEMRLGVSTVGRAVESTAPRLFHSARHLGRLVTSFFQRRRY